MQDQVDNRKIGICVPTYNRYQQTIDSFAQVIDDDRAEMVIIVDDCSTDDSYNKLNDYFYGHPKVKVYRNAINLDCYENKYTSARFSPMDNIIILDSDNTIDKSYIDALYEIPEWDEHTIYQPSFARPHFDFLHASGVTLTKENINEWMHTNVETMLNAFNFFINRSVYLRVWDGSVNPGSSDSIYYNFKWLEAGNSIYVTPNLCYEHFISDKNDGHYQQNSIHFREFHKQLLKRFKELK